MPYDAGEAFLQIVPSFKGVVTQISAEAAKWGTNSGQSFKTSFEREISGLGTNAGPKKEDAARKGAESGGAFADSFKAKVTAALKSLPPVKIDGDTSEADLKIAGLRTELDALNNLRIGVDITDAEAVAKLDELRARLDEVGATSTSVRVKVDVARASAELAAFQAELNRIDGEKVTAKVAIDTGGGAAGAESAAAGMGDLAGKMTAIIGLAPALIPVGAAAVGALSGIAAAAVAGVAGLGVLALAISGVTKAVQLLGQEQQAEASDAATASARAVAQAAAEKSAASQLVSAQAALASARASAANAAISSAEQIRNAEQSLADAERNQRQQSIASAEAVANAQESLADARRQAAEQAISSAEQVARAEESLARTEQQVADARQAAARQVANAEADLTRANQQAANAQKALNDAREQAVRDLEDSANRQADAQLSAQQAALDLQQQQIDTTKVLSSSTSTDLQKKQATLSLAEAQQRLAEAQQNAQRSTEDNTKAQAAGIEGDKGVVSAQQAVIDATNQQAAAQQSLADATVAYQRQEIDGAQQIADAQRSLADAQRAQAQQQQQSAEQIRKAQQGLADAERARANQEIQSAEQVRKAEQGVADARRAQAQQAQQSAAAVASAQRGVQQAMDAVTKAAQSGATAGGSQVARIKKELDALGPATVTFAKFWQTNIAPLFSGLQDAAAGSILPGVTDFFRDLKPLLPGISGFIKGIGGALSDLFTDAGKALKSPFWKQFGQFLSSFTAPALTTLGKTLGYLAEGFAGLFQALAPVATQFGSIVLGWAKSFADWATNLSSNKGFQHFLGYIVDSLPTVIDLFGGLLRIAGKLIDGLAPLGALLVEGAGALADFLANLTPDQLMLIVGAVGALVAVLGAPVIGLAVVGVAVAGVLVDIANKCKPLRDFIRDHLAPVVGGILHDAMVGVHDAIRDIGKAIDDHKPQLTELLNAFKDIAKFVTDHILPLLGPVLKGVFDTFGTIISGAITITSDLTTGWSDLFTEIKKVFDWLSKTFGPTLSTVWEGIKTAASAFVTDLGDIWSGIQDLFAKPVKWIVDVVLNDGLIRAWNWVVDHIGLKSLDVPKINVDLDPPQTAKPAATGHRYATGGVLPGYAPGVDSVPAMLSPGEGILRPEVVRALGADTIHGWNRAAMSGAMPRFASGGIFGTLGNIASSAWHGVTDAAGAAWGAAKDIADLLKDPLKWLAAHLTAPLNALKTIETSDFGKVVAGVPRGIGTNLLDKLKGLVGIGGGSSAPGGGAMAYAGVVRQALGMLGLNLADTNGVLSLIDHESSGNPTNVNRWDSNWTAGHPSVGLMQVIKGTFDAYAGPFRNTGPFLYGVSTDPLANIYAGVNYALHRYGESMLAAGGRHDGSGNYIGYDSGGYLAPGATLVYNGTGKPEPVFTSPQWDEIRQSKSAGSVVTMSPDLEQLLTDAASRPVRLLMEHNGVVALAYATNDVRQDRVAHGEKGWGG